MKTCFKYIMILYSFMLIYPSLYGQNSDDAKEVTETFLIKNATIYTQPGQVIQKGAILIEKGIIKEVGTNVNAPFNAMIIDADSMYVYPSFINAATHTAFKESEEEKPKAKDPGNPTYQQAGITPQYDVRTFYNAKDGSIDAMKNLGFGYLHVLPKGRMLPGQGSIILTNGKTFAEANLKENSSMYATLRSASGVFPNTILGVMSQYRDLFKNAELNKNYIKQYEMNPAGLNRPAIEPELNALHKVIDRSQPVFFKAENIKGIMRALKLQKELGFNTILTEVKQGTPILNEIKNANNPILLSLDLPKEMKEKDKKKDATDEEKSLRKTKKESYDQYVKQAKTFNDAGITYSFSYLGVKDGDIKKNFKRLIDSGLPESVVMEALTTRPAQILGISSIAGTIEKGKLGNVFISDKPYFEEKSSLQWVILDGKAEKIKKAEEGGKDNLKRVAGVWKYEIEIPGMTESGQIKIEKEGSDYNIGVSSSSSLGDYADASNIVVNDKTITFDLSVDRDGMTLDLKYELTFEKDSLSGTVIAGPFGSFPATGIKISSPE